MGSPVPMTETALVAALQKTPVVARAVRSFINNAMKIPVINTTLEIQRSTAVCEKVAGESDIHSLTYIVSDIHSQSTKKLYR